ncbi:hypothetical protein COCCADRAFT_110725 [Bipolaris zeicola 26-R-13]|uniref:Uncharacterized protein n=1 Tax=Cochliobolus carbonum (strain 26-R-13) TaxID=930089 RepID=W6Y9M6_COCC2|nr:uncharacterized protein COCCADRAFT_110725 [Bipolaris zeicola 26-R-13]EUC27816.1 hypothetical protein COCCADRAFT_110725 [Bipolaris zeicola 26-R-13]
MKTSTCTHLSLQGHCNQTQIDDESFKCHPPVLCLHHSYYLFRSPVPSQESNLKRLLPIQTDPA